MSWPSFFFIPRADFLWFFKYCKDDEEGERTIELKKRSAERAEKEIEIATIHIRRYYTSEQGAADILYTRTFDGRESEEFIMQNTGTHLRRDTVIPQWFQASKAAAASDGHAVHC
jgi:hypothetical protein